MFIYLGDTVRVTVPSDATETQMTFGRSSHTSQAAVLEAASISIDKCMEIERYSHVMHISSTVTGRLRSDLDQWDALRATCPGGLRRTGAGAW